MSRFSILLVLLCLFFSSFAWANPTFSLSNHKQLQGQTLKLEVHSDKPLKKRRVSGFKKSAAFFVHPDSGKGNYRYVAYVGIGRWVKPGMHPVTVSVTDSDGQTTSRTFSIRVKDAQFKKEHIQLKKKKQAMVRNKKNLRNENAIIAKAYKIKTKTRYIDEPFLFPVKKGRVTSTYGNMRVYNGVPSWSHSGIDIGKYKGAPIYAANRGKVVLRDNFYAHGKTLIIDHGWQIFSVYTHLDAFDVHLHEVVGRGQKIGKMGDTGIATGPHLHWGITVNHVRVNPNYWLKQSFLTD